MNKNKKCSIFPLHSDSVIYLDIKSMTVINYKAFLHLHIGTSALAICTISVTLASHFLTILHHNITTASAATTTASTTASKSTTTTTTTNYYHKFKQFLWSNPSPPLLPLHLHHHLPH